MMLNKTRAGINEYYMPEVPEIDCLRKHERLSQKLSRDEKVNLPFWWVKVRYAEPSRRQQRALSCDESQISESCKPEDRLGSQPSEASRRRRTASSGNQAFSSALQRLKLSFGLRKTQCKASQRTKDFLSFFESSHRQLTERTHLSSGLNTQESTRLSGPCLTYRPSQREHYTSRQSQRAFNPNSLISLSSATHTEREREREQTN